MHICGIRAQLSVAQKLPQAAVFIAAADDFPNGQAPPLCVVRADGGGKVPGNYGNICGFIRVQLSEDSEQQGHAQGDGQPTGFIIGYIQQLLRQLPCHVAPGQTGIAPQLRRQGTVAQGNHRHGIAPDAHIHVPAGEPGPKQAVQNLRHPLAKGRGRQNPPLLRRIRRCVEGQVHSPVRAPAFPQGTLGRIGIPAVSCCDIQHGFPLPQRYVTEIFYHRPTFLSINEK